MKKYIYKNIVIFPVLIALTLLSGCAGKKSQETKVAKTNISTVTPLPSPSKNPPGIETHGTDGSDISCPVSVPEQTQIISAQGWTIPTTGPEVISPVFTEICKINYQGQSYVVTVAEFNSRQSVVSALNALADKNQGFLYLGIPTSFINSKVPVENQPLAGVVSTDDCGMAGTEIMDENCAQGFALLKWSNNRVVVISDMFTNNHTPITSIPKEVTDAVFSK